MSALFRLAAVLVLLGCPPQDEGRSSALGEKRTMRIGETMSVEGEGLDVSFDDVLRDSRCPPDVQCIRAGEAVVVLLVRRAEGEPDRLELEVPPGGGAETIYEGYRIRVASLEPPASAGKRLERDAYRIDLVVESSPP